MTRATANRVDGRHRVFDECAAEYEYALGDVEICGVPGPVEIWLPGSSEDVAQANLCCRSALRELRLDLGCDNVASACNAKTLATTATTIRQPPFTLLVVLALQGRRRRDYIKQSET